MEANLVRILLLIVLFFLLSSDYSAVVKQLVPVFEESEEETIEYASDTDSSNKIEESRTEKSTAKIAKDVESKLH